MMKYLTLTLIIISFFCQYQVQAQQLPWLGSIGSEEKINSIHSLKAVAEVTVSDGLKYTAETFFHDPQRAVFKRIYSDRTVLHRVEGKNIWGYDGQIEQEAPDFFGHFVRGHQMHAQLLFYKRLHPEFDSPQKVKFNNQQALAITSTNESSPFSIYYTDEGLPLGMAVHVEEGDDIVMTLSEWRIQDGLNIPFRISIDDGQRVFDYKFSKIMLNHGSLSDYRAPYDELTDEQKLLRLHRDVMDDHLFGGTNSMRRIFADSMVIVGRGEVHIGTGNESVEMLGQMLENTNYLVYDDLIKPVVNISDDGTLGWVIVNVGANGVRYNPEKKEHIPFEFVSAWIELYNKKNGKWGMTGNVSNFTPESK